MGGNNIHKSAQGIRDVTLSSTALYAKRPNNQQRTDMLLDSIETSPKGPLVDPSEVTAKLGDDESLPLVHAVCKAADDRKADNIVAMRVSGSTSLTDWIIICSGNSRPQNNAIAGNIQDEVAEQFGEEYALLGNGVPEGNADSGWIILDFASVMVHVMTPKSRLFYDIEGKWQKEAKGEVQYLDLTPVLTPNPFASSKEEEEEVPAEEEEDPFWS